MGLSGVVSWVKVFIHHEDTKSTKKKPRLEALRGFWARFGFFDQASRICRVAALTIKACFAISSVAFCGAKQKNERRQIASLFIHYKDKKFYFFVSFVPSW